MPYAEFIAVNYGQSPPDCEGRVVYLLDFCYPVPVLAQMAAVATRITVIDHHKTALEALEAWKTWERPAWVEVEPCLPGKSGAGMAWDYLKYVCEHKGSGWDFYRPVFAGFATDEVPWFVQYVQDRDLWQFKLPASREYNAFLQTWPLEFGMWEILAQHKLAEDHVQFAKAGGTILRVQKNMVEDHLRYAWPIVITGKRGFIVNATVLQSEIAGELATREGAEFGACFTLTEKGTILVSLRSTEKSGTDVSALAKLFPGGGGHKHAAGFQGSVELLELMKV